TAPLRRRCLDRKRPMTTRDAVLEHAPTTARRGAPSGHAAEAEAKRAPRRKVAVFGLFGVGNHGNEASLDVVLDMLRRERPDAEIICICAGQARVARDHGVAST